MADVRPLVLKTGNLAQAGASDILLGATSVLFKQTSSKTVTNTATDTSSIGAGVGSLTLPAGFWVPGRAVRIFGGGYYSTPLASSVTTRIKLGGQQIAMSMTAAFGNMQSNAPWTFDVTVQCSSVSGSTGSFNTVGMLSFSVGTATPAGTFVGSATGPAAANVSADALLDVTNAWDAASTTRSVTTTVAVVEVLP